MSGTKLELTPEQIDALTDAIRGQFQQGAQQDAQSAFCDNWDQAKGVLQMLQPILSAVPGVGIFAGPAISVVIAAGNAAKNAVCR